MLQMLIILGDICTKKCKVQIFNYSFQPLDAFNMRDSIPRFNACLRQQSQKL